MSLTALTLTACCMLLFNLLLIIQLLRTKLRQKAVYLVDFSCYKPPAAQSMSKDRLSHLYQATGNHTDAAASLMRAAMDKAGLSDSTFVPENLLRQPFDLSLAGSRRETERVVFGAVNELVAKTGVEVDEIGILIVNCSLFRVVPSLASIIVNRYKLRESIASYCLGGMGCSCGLLAIDLANQLLKVHENTYALVVSTENLSSQYYRGSDISKTVANSVFRLGGAAVLLSNKPETAKTSKYQLIHTVRTHTASSDASYKCIFQEEDDEGFIGVTINKDLRVSAAAAIRLNLTSLGPLILPLSEKLLVLKNMVLRKIRGAQNSEPYIPNFSKGADHFFPHVGGKPVLDDLQNRLGFSDVTMEASRMTLYKFGNTSSSSIWYALAYSEAKGRIKKGGVVWQMAFGSGFKCSSVIWRAVKLVDFETENPWSDEIDEFPKNLDDIGQHLENKLVNEYFVEPK